MELKRNKSWPNKKSTLLLIELYGIETIYFLVYYEKHSLLIELYGIETLLKPCQCNGMKSFNRTIWN